MKTEGTVGLAAAIGLLWAGCINAGEITCLPDNQRVATLSDAIECKALNSVNLARQLKLMRYTTIWATRGSTKGN